MKNKSFINSHLSDTKQYDGDSSIILLCEIQNHMANERLILIFKMIKCNFFFSVLDYVDFLYLDRERRTLIILEISTYTCKFVKCFVE